MGVEEKEELEGDGGEGCSDGGSEGDGDGGEGVGGDGGVGDGVVAGGKVAPPAYGGQVLRSGICWLSQSVKWETSA